MKFNFESLKDLVAHKYGNNPGRILVHTGVIGWVLSSIAQIFAIVINDKVPKEQKMYMIPQEAADAMVNIISFFAITQLFNSASLKLVNKGKILPKSVVEHLNKLNIKNVGKKGFDVLKNGNLTSELQTTFNNFRNGIDVIGTTIGTILSCNIVTPLVRNQIAANSQKSAMTRMNTAAPDIKDEKKSYLPKPTMTGFRAASQIYPNSGSLKI